MQEEEQMRVDDSARKSEDCNNSINRPMLTRPSSTANVDIRVRVTGGGHVSQVYAIRQAIAKSIVR